MEAQLEDAPRSGVLETALSASFSIVLAFNENPLHGPSLRT